jgi:hypothetical protein
MVLKPFPLNQTRNGDFDTYRDELCIFFAVMDKLVVLKMSLGGPA